MISAISIPDNIGQNKFLAIVSLAKSVVMLLNRIPAYHTPFHSVRFIFLDNSPYFTQNIFSDDWISFVEGIQPKIAQRSAVSIINNIAEGFESGSDAKYMNFLNISRGSCGEVRSMLYLCDDLGFCTKDEREQLQTQLRKITSGIVKLSDTISKKTS